MTDAEIERATAEFLDKHGVTRCPTVHLLPSQRGILTEKAPEIPKYDYRTMRIYRDV